MALILGVLQEDPAPIKGAPEAVLKTAATVVEPEPAPVVEPTPTPVPVPKQPEEGPKEAEEEVASTAAVADDPAPAPEEKKADPEAGPVAEEEGRIAPVIVPGRSSTRLAAAEEGGPSLGGFLFWTCIVMALLGGTFWALRRFARKTGLIGDGPMRVLSRRSIAQKQQILLVEVGPRILVLGATRDRLTPLAEFRDPDEIARLRADLEPGGEGSARRSFDRSLREGLREEERPSTSGVTASIVDELAEIKKTVHAWRA